MSEKELRREFWYLDEWQLAEHEAWLTSMSAQGWHLVKNKGWGRATFARGEPQQLRYRCDVFEADSWAEQERLDLYQQAGWEHVANRGLVQIFRAPATASIPEIHTEPTEQIRNIRRLLINPSLSLLLPLLILLYGLWKYGLTTAEFLLDADWIFLTAILFLLGWICLYGAALVHLLRLLQRLRRGQRPSQSVPWQKQRRRVRVRTALLFLVLIFLWGNKFSASRSQRYPAIPMAAELPVLRLAHVMDSEAYAGAVPNNLILPQGKGDFYNYYQRKGSLLVPEQHYLVESVQIPGKTAPDGEETYSPMLHFDAYRAATPGLAAKLATALAAGPPSGPRFFSINRSQQALPAAAQTDGFDGLWLLEDEDALQRDLVAWQGNWVYYVSYYGQESVTQLLQALQTEVMDR